LKLPPNCVTIVLETHLFTFERENQIEADQLGMLDRDVLAAPR
jgi:hypothetical protein